MFKQLGDLANLMQQAQSMGSRMKASQQELADFRATGTDRRGLVEVTLTGKYELAGCRVLSAASPAELEQAFAEAITGSLNEVRDKAQRQLEQVTGGLNLPGMSEALASAGKPS